MAQSSKIISESFLPSTILNEEVDGKKTWFIEGIFVQADVVNKNRRIYSEAVLDKAINTYKNDYVAVDRAIGELNHPDGLSVSLERISHKIINITKEGKDYIGKAQVLNTPMGKTLQNLLEGGVKVGVSSRGYGSTTKLSSGVENVDDNYTIIAIDSVFHPSAPDALVQGIMEGQEWLWDRKEDDVQFLENLKEDIKHTNMKRLEEQKMIVFKKFIQTFMR